MKLLILVCLGGAAGSGTRYGAELLFKRAAPELGAVFPLATLAVNLVGCLLMGLGYGLLVRQNQGYTEELRALLLIGFCGGLTTFSAFANQTLALDASKGLLNIAASVCGCLFMTWLGLTISGGR